MCTDLNSLSCENIKAIVKLEEAVLCVKSFAG